MSDTDESAVLVDTPSSLTEPDLIPEDTRVTKKKNTNALAATNENTNNAEDNDDIELTEIQGPHACQIVSIGSEEDKYAFSFNKEDLDSILAKVPANTKVAVVSVVGAFRTGKSFLLSWFLRYLDHVNSSKPGSSTTDSIDPEWYKNVKSLGNDGFDWKAGADRNTTGIWMWSEPYLIHNKSLAVLLIDTQGMFDHETTMSLTASIFGFSTLLSSFQIYNVDKRIQEDNLQQLALFSEYARMAIGVDNAKKEQKEESVEVDDDGKVLSDKKNKEGPKPFQHIEFLVRDWQHYEEDIEDDYDAMENSMATYLEKVIAERDAQDLQDTREQILSCFDKISCYGLCHPGNAVTKRKYTGDINAMDPHFLQLLIRYCSRVFSKLDAKKIHGSFLTAEQLGVYIQAYAELFASGAAFPEAGTMLEATAKANNTNAVHKALNDYKNAMNRVAGPHCTNYLRKEELQAEHEQIRQKCLATFTCMANFGNSKGVEAAKAELLEEMNTSFEFYDSLNEGRNPLAGLEVYALPSLVAIVSYIARWFTDATCSATLCRATSEVLSHVYVVVFVFFVIVASTKAKQIKDTLQRFQKAVEVMTNDKTKKD